MLTWLAANRRGSHGNAEKIEVSANGKVLVTALTPPESFQEYGYSFTATSDGKATVTFTNVSPIFAHDDNAVGAGVLGPRYVFFFRSVGHTSLSDSVGHTIWPDSVAHTRWPDSVAHTRWPDSVAHTSWPDSDAHITSFSCRYHGGLSVFFDRVEVRDIVECGVGASCHVNLAPNDGYSCLCDGDGYYGFHAKNAQANCMHADDTTDTDYLNVTVQELKAAAAQAAGARIVLSQSLDGLREAADVIAEQLTTQIATVASDAAKSSDLEVALLRIDALETQVAALLDSNASLKKALLAGVVFVSFSCIYLFCPFPLNLSYLFLSLVFTFSVRFLLIFRTSFFLLYLPFLSVSS
jgi:hypothetical protein